MTNEYTGVIIEESLAGDPEAFMTGQFRLIKTKVEKVTKKHQTPWLKKWTLHTFAISEDKAKQFAKNLSKALEKKHNWYADFKNDKFHYIIFRNKIFKIDRTKKEEYVKATEYGIKLGIPEYQVDFSPFVKKWKRD